MIAALVRRVLTYIDTALVDFDGDADLTPSAQIVGVGTPRRLDVGVRGYRHFFDLDVPR